MLFLFSKLAEYNFHVCEKHIATMINCDNLLKCYLPFKSVPNVIPAPMCMYSVELPVYDQQPYQPH